MVTERSLWHTRAFRLLWTGETVSLVGSQVTQLALPLTAVLTLGAGAAELGILNAAKYLPFFLVTLVAGALVERRRRRPVMLAANLGRAALIGYVPLAALAGVLALEQLYALAFAVGVLTVFFDVAFWSYVPAVVGRERLTDANGKLMASASAADVGGPGLGGLLVGVLGAPAALAADALSFLASAATIHAIDGEEPQPEASGRGRLRSEVAEGLRFVFGNAILRPIACEAATFNVFANALETVFLLYALRELGMGAAMLGAVVAVGSAGALLGSLVAARLGERFGLGRTIVAATVLGCWPYLLVPLAAGTGALAVALPAAAFFAAGVGVAISNVHVVSLRQAVTPERLLARMMASYRFVVYGTIPIGALLGGVLAEAAGLRAALVIAAAGIAAAPLWVLFSPVRRVRSTSDDERAVNSAPAAV